MKDYYINSSIYYLKRFGLSSHLAKSLSDDNIQLLDLFLECSPKLSQSYSPKKMDKIKACLQSSLYHIKHNPNIFDDIYILRKYGVRVGNSKIYRMTSSILKLKLLLDKVDWESIGLLAASEKARNLVELHSKVSIEIDSQIDIARWSTFVVFLKLVKINTAEFFELGLDEEVVEGLVNDGFLVQNQAKSITFLAFDNLSFKEDLKSMFNMNLDDYYLYREEFKKVAEFEKSKEVVKNNYCINSSIYYLRRFGLSSHMAKSLSDNNIQLLDLFLEYNPKLVESFSNKKIDKIKTYLHSSLNHIKQYSNVFDEIYLLEKYGAKVDNSKIYRLTRSISKLKLLLEETDWKSIGLLVASEKARNLVEFHSKVIKVTESQLEITRWSTFVVFLKLVKINNSEFFELGLDEEIVEGLVNEGFLVRNQTKATTFLAFDNLSFKEDLKSIFDMELDDYYLYRDEFEKATELEKTNQDLITSYTLDELLSLNLEEKDLFEQKLLGKTLQEIGDFYGISRERVRQRINKFLKKCPRIVEAEYFKDLFENYSITREVFQNVFSDDLRIYELLGLFYKKGKKDINSHILNGDYSQKQKDYILGLTKQTLLDGEVVKLSRENIVRDVLKRNQNLQLYFTLDELYYLYSEEVVNQPQLEFKSSRSLGTQLDRYNHIIFSLGEGIRYHEIDGITSDKEPIVELFTDLPDGAYSMNYIFDKYVSLMEKYDLRNGSELHNFCKKYLSEILEISLGRNPEFVKGPLSKKEYINQELYQFNLEPVDDFLNYMNLNFGLHKGSLSAYLSLEFNDNILNGRVFYNDEEFIEECQIVLPYLVEDIYLNVDFNRILKKHLEIDTISSSLIFALGYMPRGSLVIKKDYRTIVEAVFQQIVKNKTFCTEGLSYAKVKEFLNAVNYLEKQLKIIKISKDTYMSIEYLSERGYSREKFEQFIKEVEDFVEENDYFSIYSLIEDGISSSILNDGFELMTLDRLLGVSEDIKSVSVGFPNIYCKSVIKKSINDFLIDTLLEYESSDLEDFVYDINKKYGTTFDEYDVQVRLINSGAFYSKELNKVYIDKEDYLREVYGT